MHYKEVKSYLVQNDVIDMQELLERVDQDYELLQELFRDFVEDMPSQYKKIKEAINLCDCEQVKILAHRLKGTLGNLSAKRAYDLAKEMEIAAGQNKLETMQHIYADMTRETELAMDTLESLIRDRQF